MPESYSETEEGEERPLYKIPAANLASLEERIAKLARRGAKLERRGLLDPEEPIGMRVIEEVREPQPDKEGYRTPDEVFFMVEVTGSTPKIGGWEFVATLQHEMEGTILRALPTAQLSADELAAYREAPADCAHCRLPRQRGDTYLVRNVETGELCQVGSGCILDFVGTQDPAAMASLAELLIALGDMAEEAENEGWGDGGAPDFVGLDRFLAYVAMLVRELGWTSRTRARTEEGARATADLAWEVIFRKEDPVDPKPRPTDEDAERGRKALDWTRQDLADLPSLSDYQHNLNIVIQQGAASYRTAGLAASILPYYERALTQYESRKRMERSEWFGTPKKRETWRLYLDRVFSVEGYYGTTHIHKFFDEDDNVAIWFSSRVRLDPAEWYDVTATVKEHNLRDGVEQTILTRAKAVEIEDPESRAAEEVLLDPDSYESLVDAFGPETASWIAESFGIPG